MYIVVIEWDGMKPPTTYYHRLRKLAFRVRGNKNQSPLARRSGDDNHGVIMQEGAIMTNSESLARTIAYLARRHGAAFVSVGTIDMNTEFVPNKEDINAFHRIEEAFGKRGRQAQEKIDWVVLCIEEARVYQVHDANKIAVCPICMATKIKARPGTFRPLKVPTDDTLENAWLRTRFSTGVFEPATSQSTNENEGASPPKISKIKFADEGESKVAKTIVESKAFINDLENIAKTMNKTNARSLRLMDAAFIGRSYYSQSERQKARVRAATEVFRSGADPSLVSLLEKDDQVDLLDMAMNIQPESIANYWLLVMSNA